ncbi:MAG: DEAD/DEAH box helicase [Okeania sp. SIO2H7]|nr:DEAD/DEAH box helicase [Okeania sp. SIO2H7]
MEPERITTTEKQLYLNLTAEKKYPPRDYQLEAVRKVFEAFTKHRRVLLQLPTGTGKTPTFCYIARKFLEQGEGVLVIAHRQELIYQAREKIEAISGVPAGLIKAGKPVNPEYDIQVASVQTLVKRKGFPDISLLVVDEAHHACTKSYDRIFEAYPNAYILGVTATPNRSDGQGLKNHFDELITLHQTQWFIEKGYLSPYKIFASPKRIDTTGIKITGGDYNLEKLSEQASTIVGNVLETWKKIANNKQTVVFAVDVKNSMAICQSFIDAGISAAHLDGETPPSLRREIINDFGKQKIKVLTNCGIVTEGFDCPAIEVVQVARPTASLVLWLQIVGRGLRPFPGKDSAIIIDHTYNSTTLGLPDENFDWSLDPISLEGLRFNQECPNCQHIFRPLAHELKPHRKIIDAENAIVELARCTCPNCEEVFEFQLSQGGNGNKPREINQEFGELEELNLTLHPWAVELIDNLVWNQEFSHKKKAWVKFRLEENPRVRELSLGDWRYAANKLGYKPGWAWHRYQETQTN